MIRGNLLHWTLGRRGRTIPRIREPNTDGPFLPHPKPKLLFVGAFPPANNLFLGGNVADCATLMASSFAQRFEIIPLDSTAFATAPPLRQRIALAAHRMLRFLRTMRTQRPDAVLLFCSGGLSFLEKGLFAAYASATGTHSLLSIRSGHFMDQVRRSRAFRFLARRLLLYPRLLLCQGTAWQRFFHEWFGIAPTRCPIVENWVATDDLVSIGTARQYADDSTPKQILFLGWIEPFKGVFDLLEALARLAHTPGVPAFRATIAGDGGHLSAAREWVFAHRLESHIDVPGTLRGDAKLRALARADVFVLPSHTEGLPNAMVEAMAAGLPVIVTPVGSIPDVIDNGVNGVLVPCRDPESLAATIRVVLTSAATRESLGRAAHDTAKLRFAVERAASALAALVHDALRPAAADAPQPPPPSTD